MPSTLRPILGSTSAPKDELYSEQQVQAALLSYAAASDLQQGSDSLKLDRLMVSNLFNKKEPQNEGDVSSLEDLMKRLLGEASVAIHHVLKRSIPALAKGSRNFEAYMC